MLIYVNSCNVFRPVKSIERHQLKYQQTKDTIGHRPEPVYASTRVKYIFVCDSYSYLRHKLYTVLSARRYTV